MSDTPDFSRCPGPHTIFESATALPLEVWLTCGEEEFARKVWTTEPAEGEVAAFIEGAMDEQGHVVRLKFHTPGKYCQRCENDKDLYGTSFYNLDTREHYLVMSMVMVKRPAAL